MSHFLQFFWKILPSFFVISIVFSIDIWYNEYWNYKLVTQKKENTMTEKEKDFRIKQLKSNLASVEFRRSLVAPSEIAEGYSYAKLKSERKSYINELKKLTRLG